MIDLPAVDKNSIYQDDENLYENVADGTVDQSDGITYENVQFDSAVDDCVDPKWFVIFNDTQAYPLYLVTLTDSE